MSRVWRSWDGLIKPSTQTLIRKSKSQSQVSEPLTVCQRRISARAVLSPILNFERFTSIVKTTAEALEEAHIVPHARADREAQKLASWPQHPR